MDLLGLLIVPNWLLVLVVLLYAYYRYMNRNKDHFKKRGIKELPNYGTIGTVKSFVKMAKIGIQGIDLENIKKYGKFYGYMEMQKPMIMIADTDILKQILVKDSLAHFSDRRQDFREFLSEDFEGNLSSKIGEDWKQTRNMLTPVFSAGKLKKMMDLINQVASRTIKNLRENADDKKEFNSKLLFGSFTMDAVASTMFGLDIDSQNDKENLFVKNAQKVFGGGINNPIILIFVLFPFMMPYLMKIPAFKRWVQKKETTTFFREVISRAVEQRKAAKLNRPDMIQLMLNVHVADAEDNVNDGMDVHGAEQITEGGVKTPKRGMTSSEILANALIFFLAGFETTATALTFMSWVLARYPDIQTKLIQEVDDVVGDDEQITYEQINKMTYLDQVFCETLRMWPPATRSDRTCTRDIVLSNGVKVVQGDIFAIPIYAVHHLEEYWGEDHLTFKPERFTPEQKKERNPYTYLPFGIGPRGCIGMRLAILEAKTVMVKVLQSLKFVPGPNMLSDTDVNEFEANGFSKTKKDIKVMVERR